MSRSPQHRTGWHAIAGAALVLLAVVLFADGCRRWWPRTVDDAFIVFRYSLNLVEGHGLVYNPGERVEGYSSLAWVLLHAAAIAVGLEPVLVSKVAGIGASLALAGMLWPAARRVGIGPVGCAVAMLILGSSVVLQIWAVSGLETNLYAALLFGGLALLVRALDSREAVLASALLTAAALTRPEGLAYWLLGLLVVGLVTPAVHRPRRALLYLLPGLAWVAHLAWRHAYYGDLLPNTYYAKTGGGPALWVQGGYGLGLFARNLAHWPWLLAATAGAVAGLVRRETRRGTIVMAGAVLLHLLYVVSVGDDGLTIHRFYVPVLAPLAWLTLLVMPTAGASWRSAVLAVAVGLAAIGSLRTLHTQLLPGLHAATLVYQHGNVALGRHLARTREPGTWIAVAAAGAIPYYSKLPAIDMYGLNEATIAHGPFPTAPRGRMMKWDVEHVLARQPQLIALNRGYFAAGDPRLPRVLADPASLGRTPLDQELLERLLAPQSDYELRPLHLGDGSVFFVFERRAASAFPTRQPTQRE